MIEGGWGRFRPLKTAVFPWRRLAEDSDGFQVLCHPSESGYGRSESGKPSWGGTGVSNENRARIVVEVFFFWILAGGFKIFKYFHPYLEKMNSFWRIDFFQVDWNG